MNSREKKCMAPFLPYENQYSTKVLLIVTPDSFSHFVAGRLHIIAGEILQCGLHNTRERVVCFPPDRGWVRKPRTTPALQVKRVVLLARGQEYASTWSTVRN